MNNKECDDRNRTTAGAGAGVSTAFVVALVVAGTGVAFVVVGSVGAFVLVVAVGVVCGVVPFVVGGGGVAFVAVVIVVFVVGGGGFVCAKKKRSTNASEGRDGGRTVFVVGGGAGVGRAVGNTKTSSLLATHGWGGGGGRENQHVESVDIGTLRHDDDDAYGSLLSSSNTLAHRRCVLHYKIKMFPQSVQ
jgi:hypothetical protein